MLDSLRKPPTEIPKEWLSLAWIWNVMVDKLLSLFCVTGLVNDFGWKVTTICNYFENRKLKEKLVSEARNSIYYFLLQFTGNKNHIDSIYADILLNQKHYSVCNKQMAKNILGTMGLSREEDIAHFMAIVNAHFKASRFSLNEARKVPSIKHSSSFMAFSRSAVSQN